MSEKQHNRGKKIDKNWKLNNTYFQYKYNTACDKQFILFLI